MLPHHRSELAVPASSPDFFAKAAASDADAIFLDLEDAVPVALKITAREAAVTAIDTVDWGPKTLSVRVNGLDTEWGCRDIVALAESCRRLDRILLPKCESAAHVRAVEFLVAGIEQGTGRRPLEFELLIETHLGVAHVEEIARASPRIRTLVFGGGDYQLSMQVLSGSTGSPSPHYTVASPDDPERVSWGDNWHAALARVANAARAYGLQPIDGPYTDIGNREGFRRAAERSAALGYEGKWAIHPSQIAAANAVYSPSAAQVAWGREVIEALDGAARRGRGAVRLASGDMVDHAHRKLAERILERETRGGVSRPA